MDEDDVKVVDVTSEGLIVTFKDGQEGLIKGGDLRDCVEQTDGFARLKDLEEVTTEE